MSLRTILIAVSALACAGLAALGVSRSLNRKGPAEPSATVLFVVSDVPRGVLLSASDISQRPFPKSMMPPGVLTKPEEAIGRAAVGHLHKDELLMEAKLASKGSKGGIAGLIPPGMRAIAIQTPNVATGVAGFILPGNKIDVLITLNSNSGSEAVSTMPLLENVEILAVDQRVDAPAENKVDAAQMRSVTLLVTSEDANKLNLGMSRGTLHLSLRNPTDNGVSVARPVTLRDIRREPEPAPAPVVVAKAEEPKPPSRPAPPRPPTILRMIRGTGEGLISLPAHEQERVLPPPESDRTPTVSDQVEDAATNGHIHRQ